jgi:hypothetical protein
MKILVLVSLFGLLSCSSGNSPETANIEAEDTFNYRAEVTKYTNDFKICFERYTPSATKVSLKVVLLVEPDGDITKKQFYANQKITEELKGCLTEVIKQLDFPSSKNGGTIEVTHQMNFQLRK